ncbi:hypothetical protein HDU97_009904 [Phlyctochytrium planicorne]|nr:hypothetical protein HDU97_009904 [Phlyctochytrium planicorne]
MILTFKTLKNENFTIEVEPSIKVGFCLSCMCLKARVLPVVWKCLAKDVEEAPAGYTIGDVKRKVEEAKGFVAAQQKLIHSGKVLDDESTVEGCKIQEKDFLVLMVVKPKTQPTAAPASTSTAAAPAPAPAATANPATPAQPAASAAAATPAPTPTTAAAPAVTATPTPAENISFDASTLATGNELVAARRNLIEMGFSEEEVGRAMRAAFNNPDRAAEYLVNGIPANLDLPAAPAAPAARAPSAATSPAAGNPPAAAAPAPATGSPYVNLFEAAAAATANQQAGARGAAPGAGAGAPNAASLERLLQMRNSPQFEEFRNLIRNQPALLQPLLQQIGSTQPELLQAITQNQDAFMQMLGDGGDGGDDEGGDGAPPGTQYISVSPEEEQAINRLAALGFDRMAAAEAFFACDKNEELAANFLFDSMNQD